MEPMKHQIIGHLPEDQREKAAAEMETQFQSIVDRTIEETIKPYEQYFPLMITGGVLFTLNTIFSFVSWIPPILINIIFLIFKEMKIIRRRMLNIAGKLTRPHNKLTLSINNNEMTKKLIQDFSKKLNLPLVA